MLLFYNHHRHLTKSGPVGFAVVLDHVLELSQRQDKSYMILTSINTENDFLILGPVTRHNKIQSNRFSIPSLQNMSNKITHSTFKQKLDTIIINKLPIRCSQLKLKERLVNVDFGELCSQIR